LSLGQRVGHGAAPFRLYLNAHTVLNASSPCQFFFHDFAGVFDNSEKISAMGLLQIVVLGAAGAAAMRAALERGDLDEAARQGALAGPAVVERALRSPDRTTQLAAIAAAPVVEDRAELLVPLARLAGGADRRVAIPAAAAARRIALDFARHDRPDDLADDDVATWRAAWAGLALRGDRWIELRLLALDTAVALDPAGLGIELAAGRADPDPAFRRAVASLTP
jgi:hypothetical protein